MTDTTEEIIFNEPFVADDTINGNRYVAITIKLPKDYRIDSDLPKGVVDKAIQTIIRQKHNIGPNPVPYFRDRRICFILVG